MESGLADLVITDNRMPLYGGITLLKLFTKKCSGAASPIIVYSRNLTNELKERAFKAGVFAVVPKPVLKKLLSSVEETIAHSPSV